MSNHTSKLVKALLESVANAKIDLEAESREEGQETTVADIRDETVYAETFNYDLADADRVLTPFHPELRTVLANVALFRQARISLFYAQLLGRESGTMYVRVGIGTVNDRVGVSVSFGEYVDGSYGPGPLWIFDPTDILDMLVTSQQIEKDWRADGREPPQVVMKLNEALRECFAELTKIGPETLERAQKVRDEYNPDPKKPKH